MTGGLLHAVFLAVRAGKVESADLMEDLRRAYGDFAKHSGGQVFAVFLFFILVILVMVFAHLIRQKVLRRRTLDNVADEYGMTVNEKEVMDLLAATLPEERRGSIFGSLKLFEIAVDNYVRELARKKASQALRRLRDGHIRSIRRKMNFAGLAAGDQLQSTRELTPGQKVILEPPDKRVRYTTSITAVSELELRAVLDVDEDEMPGLEEGEPFIGHFWRPGEGLYRFRTRLEKLAFQLKPELVLEHSAALEYFQNRAFPRVEVNREFAFSRLSQGLKDGSLTKPEEIRGVMRDISGGGLCFTFDRPVAVGDFVSFDYDVDGEDGRPEAVALIAEVLALNKLKDGAVIARAEFIATPDESRDKLVAFVEKSLKSFSDGAPPA